jgi:hypothetical protein
MSAFPEHSSAEKPADTSVVEKVRAALGQPLWMGVAICAVLALCALFVFGGQAVEREKSVEEREMDEIRVAKIRTELGKTDVPVPQDLLEFPNFPGYGYVHDLRQAMARDKSGELKALVEAWFAECDVDERNELQTQMIFVWSGVDHYAPDSRGPNIDGRKLYALEQWLADPFEQVGGHTNPLPMAAKELEKAWQGLFDTLSDKWAIYSAANCGSDGNVRTEVTK